MGQSLVKNAIHITFSTKYRQPLITEDIESELFAYLGGICNKLECQTIIVGGYIDHVHIACFLSKKIALMKLLEEVKGHSSKWIKTKSPEFENFYWQNGYGALSVQANGIDVLVKYIQRQKEHHKNISFQEEFRALMKEHGIDFDEKFVWD